MRRTWSEWAPLPLRLVLGFGLAYHGFPKLFTAEGRASIAGMLGGLGVPAPGIMGWVVGTVEFVGGVLLIVGAFVAVVSLLAIIDMVVAMLLVHLPQGFNFMHITGMTEAGLEFGMPGYEVNLLYIAGLLALLLGGAGALSVDRRRAGAASGSLSEPPLRAAA
ncbi:MAG: DoxX family protein [Longimicrobiales bacterium]